MVWRTIQEIFYTGDEGATFYFSENQSPRMAEADRALWSPPGPTPAEAGTPIAGCPGACPGGF